MTETAEQVPGKRRLETLQALAERAQEALRASEAKFAAAFGQSPLALTVTSLENGRLVDVNEGFLRLSGYTREEALGRTPEELGLWVEPELRAERFARLRAGEHAPNIEARFRVKSGKELIGVIGSALVEIDGRPCVLSSVTDITERKQAEEALHRERALLAAVLQHLPVGVIIAEAPSGKLILGNQQVAGIWRHEFIASENVEQYEVYKGFHPDGRPYRAHEWPLARTIATGEVVRQEEIRFQRGDGSFGWMAVSSDPIRDDGGRIIAGVVTFTDITERRQAAEALRESEERYRLVTRATHDAVWDWDMARDQVVWSESLHTVFGYLPEQAGAVIQDAFQWWTGHIHPDDREHVGESFQRAARAGRTEWIEEYRFQRADGAYAEVRDAAFIVFDDEGRPVRMVGAMIDITERKRAEEALRASEERYRLLTRVLTSIVWQTDAAGAFVSEQPEWAAFTGQAWEEYRGWGWSDALHPDDRARVRELWRQALEARSMYESQGRVWHGPSGEYRYFVARAVPLLNGDGSVREWIGTVTDIHEQRKAEEALKEADRRKDEFLAMLAHELRNPLAPIRSAAQVLKLLGPEDAHQQWARAVIERQTQHLTRLVDDLLDVSRITRGKITLAREPLDLAMIVNRATETSRPLIDARRHHLTVALPPEPVRVEGDLTRLVQIVGNLLNNAAKYTDEGGHIQLAAAREGDEAVIRVRDDGMGLPADLLPHVFDLFTQANRSLDRSQGGLGIGLTLVRQLAEMHGGRVEARSDGPGRGSEFIVRLPVSAPAAAAGAGERDGERAWTAARALRILLVDDNLDSAEMLAMVLKLGGHEVRIAHDGPKALEAARAFQPQVVLCDLGLPGMNGFEVAARLRQQPAFRRTPLIALTGYGQEEDRRRSKEAGFNYHLTKPVEPDALGALLDSLRADRPAG